MTTTPDPVTLHEPVIVTDGGPWAMHDYACPVCQERKAVIDLSAGHFQPCWSCQEDGWHVARRRRWQARKVRP